MVAAQSGHTEIVKKLIEHGANISARNKVQLCFDPIAHFLCLHNWGKPE